MNTYIIIYNGETDFLKTETNHPETLIKELFNEGYAQDDIELYRAEELSIEVELKEIGIKISNQ